MSRMTPEGLVGSAPTAGLRAALEQWATRAEPWTGPASMTAEDGYNAAIAEVVGMLNYHHAALEAEPPATGLDVAWAKAEAALPEGWLGPQLVQSDDMGWTASTCCRELPSDGGYEHESHADEQYGPTPAAALAALAARLTETAR